jgi:hypothetical protein
MSRTASKTLIGFLIAGSVTGGVVACGGSSGGGGGAPKTSTFVGVVSANDGSTSGSISFTIQTGAPAPPAVTGPSLTSPVNATGTLSLGGSQTALTGTYDPDTDILAAAGGGYSFGGGFDGVDRIEGQWAGPGNTSGTFVTTQSTAAVSFCGTYAAADQTDAGTFSFVISGTTLRGEAVSSVDGSLTPLDGVVNGNTITIYLPGTTLPVATGTRNGNNVSGTYADPEGGAGSTGTWTGSVCQ